MRTCTICRHNGRDEIDQSLIAGEAYRNISRRTGTSVTALFRHKKDHLPATLAVCKQAAQEIQATTLYSRLRLVHHQTATILQEALASRSPNLALAAIARLEKQIELEAKLIGELDESVKVAVGVTVKPLTPATPGVDLLAEENLAILSDEEHEQFIRTLVKLRDHIRARQRAEAIEATAT
jgi:hypothetical protein